MKKWVMGKNLFGRELRVEKETTKCNLVLRRLSILMCAYFMVLGIFFMIFNMTCMAIVSLCCLIGQLFVFEAALRNKRLTALFSFNIFTLLWIVFFILILGGSTGVQHFLFLLVMLTCLITYENHIIKGIYITIMAILRIGLIFYTQKNAPRFTLDTRVLQDFQIINTIIIMMGIGLITMILSNYSKKTEKQILIYNKKLEQAACTDYLTGLPNRRGIIQIMEALMEELHQEEKSAGKNDAQVMNRICSIGIGDVDFFKKINDQFGHDCGDVVLKELAKLFQDFLTEKDMVGRWGGEEFLFVFPDCDENVAFSRLNELNERLSKLIVFYDENPIRISMTFGVAECDTNDIYKTLKRADDKLFFGKRTGRNQVVL